MKTYANLFCLSATTPPPGVRSRIHTMTQLLGFSERGEASMDARDEARNVTMAYRDPSLDGRSSGCPGRSISVEKATASEKLLERRLQSGFDRPVRGFDGVHASGGDGDGARTREAFDLGAELRERSCAQHGARAL